MGYHYRVIRLVSTGFATRTKQPRLKVSVISTGCMIRYKSTFITGYQPVPKRKIFKKILKKYFKSGRRFLPLFWCSSPYFEVQLYMNLPLFFIFMILRFIFYELMRFFPWHLRM
jgi:hypothetical protein